ncbi:ABC transporter B family member 29, chloroplastic [Sesamum alatum]|uniref:ABC transporter B family member 29, chloroplastic n=1 Tax=Sesamum alatum TaxID=300844 RepID=A0AAE1XWP5_9LAMI|nr:ABC transporter B family member 29, chloroplastic [Sesamum alatum]
MASLGSFPAADVEKELNPGADKNFQVDPVSSDVAASKEVKDRVEAAKKDEKIDALQNFKTAIIVSGMVVAVLVLVFFSLRSLAITSTQQSEVFPSQRRLMAQFLRLPPPYSSSCPPSLFHLKLGIPTRVGRTRIANHFPVPFSLRSSSALATDDAPCNASSPSIKLASLAALKPYLQSEWRPIISGWLCSAISVYSLSRIVPLAGKLSSVMTTENLMNLRSEGLILGVLVLTRIVANYLQQALLWEAALSCVCKVRVYVFNRVLQRDLGFFEGEKGILPGDVAYRITAEADDIADTVYSLLNTIVPSTLQLSAMATQMLVISPVLSLISALVIPSMALIIGCLGEKLRTISNKAQLSTAAMSAYLNEVLPSILFVKANNAESSECIRFQLLASADVSACLKKKQMKVLIPQIVQIMFFGILFMFGASSFVVSSGTFNCSTMVSFITSLVLLIDPIQGVGKAYNELKQGEPAIERLFNLTLFKSQVIDKPDAVDLASITGEVKVCGLSFTYGDSITPVLDGLDLHIKAGETIALVGPSGGGKTTLVKLLLRLYEPLSGSILIDGYDIRNIQLESLRKHVGLVSQDTVLFSGTIAENIGYRDLISGIDMDRVKLAAQIANADEFIRSLPDQYQTSVGPRGSNFSGGQKQRLAIARALYQNPSILILDEATSALDSRSEFLVRQALQRLLRNRTVLVIAHRLETVLMAERIFMLNDGKLQQLNHSDLLDVAVAAAAAAALPSLIMIRFQLCRFDAVLLSTKMDTSNPAVFVNAELLRIHVGRRVRAVIQVLRSEGGNSVIGKSTDEQQLVIKGRPPGPLSTYVEVIGIADSNQSIQAEIWTNFGDVIDTVAYNNVCQLANGDFKHLFI